ncbi:MAG TPA: COX15/CtaA family protein, partial [Burkholderiaceae bacterium]
ALVFAIAAVGVLIAARETGDVDATRLHLAHRTLAFVLAALIAGVLIASARRAPALAAALGAALVLQIVLGLTNAFSQTPLVAATVHNAVAATIVVLLAAILRRAAPLFPKRQP